MIQHFISAFQAPTAIFFSNSVHQYCLLRPSKLQERELEKKAEKQAELKEEKRRIREKRRESDANAAREVQEKRQGARAVVGVVVV